MTLLDLLFTVLAPHACLACQAEGALLCDQCASHLPPVLPRCYRCGQSQSDFQTCSSCRHASPLRQVWAVTPYENLAKQLLHAVKFERAQAGAQTIAAAIAKGLPEGADWLIAPIPTAPARVRARGYDQARLIAREVARLTGQPYAQLLARSGNQRQLGQKRTVRQQQLRDAFRVTQPSKLRDHHVLLIDDVLTTGATCEAAAHTLQAAGVHQVSAAVFAAAERAWGNAAAAV